MKTVIAAVATFATLATSSVAFAAQPQYIAVPQQPVQYIAVPAPQPVRTPAFCDNYARDWANWAAGDRGTRAAVGGLIGAGLGALIGNGAGRPGLGALIGGGIGAGIGAYSNNAQWQAEYNNAYGFCMNGYQLSYPWYY